MAACSASADDPVYLVNATEERLFRRAGEDLDFSFMAWNGGSCRLSAFTQTPSPGFLFIAR